MKTDARTSIALVLLTIGATAVTGTASAQDAQPQQPAVPPQPTQPQAPLPAPGPSVPTQQAPQVAPQPAAPPPAQYVPPSPPPAQYSPPPPAVPQSPPPARYPSSSQYPYLPQQQPPPAQYATPQWEHSESTYPGGDNVNGFRYHPFRFHIDGGGTLTEKANAQDYADGWNAGFGLTWYPTSHLPLGLRLDGTYNEFNIRNPLLAQVAQANGTGVYHGFQRMWGGDADLELDLHLSPYVRTYLLAGGGWYKQETLFRQSYFDNGYGCDWWSCGLTVARYDRNWTFARNAGLGLEFALGPDASFFVEGRYMRLNPTDAKSDYIPIHAGLRF
jgi:opacity protein-like surface antigen